MIKTICNYVFALSIVALLVLLVNPFCTYTIFWQQALQLLNMYFLIKDKSVYHVLLYEVHVNTILLQTVRLVDCFRFLFFQLGPFLALEAKQSLGVCELCVL